MGTPADQLACIYTAVNVLASVRVDPLRTSHRLNLKLCTHLLRVGFCRRGEKGGEWPAFWRLSGAPLEEHGGVFGRGFV